MGRSAISAVCSLPLLLLQIYQFLITSNIPFSALIMVAIAVDRYLCICHPWRSAALMNQSRAKLVVMALALFSAAIGVCVALMYGVFRSVYLPANYQNLTHAELAAVMQSENKYILFCHSVYNILISNENDGFWTFGLWTFGTFFICILVYILLIAYCSIQPLAAILNKPIIII